MMKTHARTGSLALAGAALLAASLTAGPALAAKPAPGPSLDKTTCEAGGGTYTATKNTKTCQTETPVPGSEFDRVSFTENYNADRTVNAQFFVRTLGYEVSLTTLTQKGKGPVTTTVSSSTDDRITAGTVLPDGRTCRQFDANGGSAVLPDNSLCEELGLYVYRA